MGKYFKRFENHSQYEQYKQSENYITPNISVCGNGQEVHYNPIIIDPHEYVDLGLTSGTLWATENIKDADGNELYFAWGETQGYTAEQVGTDKNFSWNDYKFGTQNNLNKYNSTDNKTILDAEDDAATINWGSNWCIPTKEQYYELKNGTSSEWTQIDGVNGMLLTSKSNENTLFLPAVGYAENSNTAGINVNGFFWLCYRSDTNNNNAFYPYFKNGTFTIYDSYRYYGFPVRPVRANN